jgi:DUF1365 family protein
MSAAAFVSSDYHVILWREHIHKWDVDIDICGQLERVLWVVAMIWAFIADDKSMPSSSWTTPNGLRLQNTVTDCLPHARNLPRSKSFCYCLFFPFLGLATRENIKCLVEYYA